MIVIDRQILSGFRLTDGWHDFKGFATTEWGMTGLLEEPG